MNNKYVILLTGCVNPKGMVYTALNDPQIRKKQYIEAIRFYLFHTEQPIVFCENTLSDIKLSDIDNSASDKRLEIITFNGNNFNKSLGKGYGECEIIEFAYKHSKMIQCSEFIVKITGRIIIPDIVSFLQAHQKTPAYTLRALMPNIKDHTIDSRFIIAPTSFFPRFYIPKKNSIDDSKGYFFEHLLYDTVLFQKDFYYIPFISYPHFHGLSGSLGVPFFPYEIIHALYYRKDCCLFIKKSPLKYPIRKIPAKFRIYNQFLLFLTTIKLYFYKIKIILTKGKLSELFKT